MWEAEKQRRRGRGWHPRSIRASVMAEVEIGQREKGV